MWARTEKSVPLSPEARAALGVEAESLDPDELVRAILRAPVDLLWNGGIGTFVKASDETHAEVGDRDNDAIRVDGRELRARVVGEGGNLGLTQLGRIEYASAGGRINTDAIDNSAGVDCSDHEVNIKILLGAAVERGSLTLEERDELLAAAADEVCDLVLYDNYLQAQILSQEQETAPQRVEAHEMLMRELELEGLLHRELEALPAERPAGRAPAPGARADAPGAGGAAGLRQAQPLSQGARLGDSRRSGARLACCAATSRAASSRPRASSTASTACGARSWPRS